MSWLGLDIGGANLKAADGAGWARSVPFALWREPQNLDSQLKTLIASAPAADRLAVTMTGELCDCFRNKAEGVRHILSAVDRAADGRDVAVYQVDGQFVSTAAASALPQLAAASNWHALAAFAGRYVPSGTSLLIDIGSTTTDIIPIRDGRVAVNGPSDLERLASSELLYRGVKRTPVCAVCQSLPWNDRKCQTAAEFFATTADAYVLLEMLDEEPDVTWTADGKPLTKEYARQRLARQVCADACELGPDAIDHMAAFVKDAQLRDLARAIRSVAKRLTEMPGTFILSGCGAFLATIAVGNLPDIRYRSLTTEIGEGASECAPAHAVAVLAKELENAGNLNIT
jgi:probable H4MPT-linked C1 transfer pathway protein